MSKRPIFSAMLAASVIAAVAMPSAAGGLLSWESHACAQSIADQKPCASADGSKALEAGDEIAEQTDQYSFVMGRANSSINTAYGSLAFSAAARACELVADGSSYSPAQVIGSLWTVGESDQQVVVDDQFTLTLAQMPPGGTWAVRWRKPSVAMGVVARGSKAPYRSFAAFDAFVTPAAGDRAYWSGRWEISSDLPDGQRVDDSELTQSFTQSEVTLGFHLSCTAMAAAHSDNYIQGWPAFETRWSIGHVDEQVTDPQEDLATAPAADGGFMEKSTNHRPSRFAWQGIAKVYDPATGASLPYQFSSASGIRWDRPGTRR